MRVALFDYGAGNLHSLAKAIEAEGVDVEVTTDPESMLSGDALVLPGVGAFQAATAALPEDKAGLRNALAGGFPCLGICLGMQLLFDSSTEGAGEGIGLIRGPVSRLEAGIVPQMGWNDVSTGGDPIFAGIDGMVAYYAHSFVCEPTDPDVVIARSEVDGRPFAAAVRSARTWGVQFHPEKSSDPGRRLIRNFLAEVAS